MYFYTDDPMMIEWLTHVLVQARDYKQSIRLDVDSQGRLRVKRGESIWSIPFESRNDPYRDLSQNTTEVTLKNYPTNCDKAVCRSTREGPGHYVNGVWTPDA